MPRKAATVIKKNSPRSQVKADRPVAASGAASAGGRVRGARSTASLATIQASIEKQFKLPKGSVALVAPGRRKMDDTAVVQDLRDRWADR